MGCLRVVLMFVFFNVALQVATHASVRLDHQFGEAMPSSAELNKKELMDDLQNDDMDPKESKRRLGLLFVKMDSDKNGKVCETEFKDWIIFAQKRYVLESTESLFDQYDLNKDKRVTWSEYEEASQKLGPTGTAEEEADANSGKRGIEYDRRKFTAADTNSDGNCDRQEFETFLHPETYEHMRSFIVKETLMDLDSDNNGYVEKEEFVGSNFAREMLQGDSDLPEKMDEYFSEYLDIDRDGVLNSYEILRWVAPATSEQALEEAKYLISVADEDQDGFVNEKEMINNSQTFIGSQVTDFGEMLRGHDEL